MTEAQQPSVSEVLATVFEQSLLSR